MLLLAAALFFAPRYEMTLPESVLQPVFDPAGNLYFDSRDPVSAYHTLTRLDPDGNVVYRGTVAAPAGMQSQFLGPLVTDAAGNLYVLTQSAPPGEPLQCLLSKLDPAGKLVYSLGLTWAVCAPAQTGVELIALGPDGSVYIAGSTLAAVPQSGQLLETTPGAYVPVSATAPNQLDAYVIKVDPKGAGVVYATYLNPAPKQGSGWTTARALAVDAQGNAYVAGTTEDAGFPTTPGAFQATCNCSPTNPGIFVVKLNGDGSRAAYSTLIQPEPFAYTPPTDPLKLAPVPPNLGISVDAAGRATIAQVQEPYYYVVLAADTPMGLSTTTLAPDGLSGNYASFTFPMRSRSSVASDGKGNLMIAGPNGPAGLPITPGALTNGTSFAAVVRLSDGAVLYATRLPNGAASVIAPDPSGGFLLTGSPTIRQSAQITTPITRFVAAQPGPPAIFGVSNSGGLQVSPGLAPGELVTIEGVGLGPVQGVAGQYGPDGTLPRQLGGTSVTFNGIAASLLYTSGQQINAIVPFAIHGGATVTVRVSAGGTTAQATLPQHDLDPEGLRSYDSGPLPGGFPGAHFFALNQDGTVNSAANPAKAGSMVTLFLSGGGLMTPSAQEGQMETAGATLVAPIGVVGEVVGPQGECCLRANIGGLTVTSAPGLPAGLVEVVFPAHASNKELIIGLNLGSGVTGGSTTGAIWVN